MRQRIASRAPRDVLLTLSLFLLALVPRLIVLLTTFDYGGDAAVRATRAHVWAQSPRVLTNGVWLPAFFYLMGTANMLIGVPSVASRVVNVALGSLTVSTVYLLTRFAYDRPVALISALTVTVMPLHIGLSASSLAETTFAFALVLATLLFFEATIAPAHRAVILIAAVVALLWAEATRYEAWVVAWLFPLYDFVRRRDRRAAGLLLAAVMTFPAYWILGNYIASGQPLIGFDRAVTGITGARHVPLTMALYTVASTSAVYLGYMLPLAAMLGVGWQVLDRRDLTPERGLLLALLVVPFVVLVQFTIARGVLYGRYLAFAYVMSLPFASSMLVTVFGRCQRLLYAAVLVMLASMEVMALRYEPNIEVTRREPVHIKQVAEWLRTSDYRRDAVLVTQMNWDSSHLALYFPEVATRSMIVWPLAANADISAFLNRAHPRLLITQAGDETDRARIEALLEPSQHIGEPAYTAGNINVYPID